MTACAAGDLKANGSRFSETDGEFEPAQGPQWLYCWLSPFQPWLFHCFSWRCGGFPPRRWYGLV